MCTSCGHQAIVDEIDDLICEDEYQWCLETLEGIYSWVVENKHVTDKQREALDNIRNATERKG